jgi:DNA (cytosine-5)-methyltransferase 1
LTEKLAPYVTVGEAISDLDFLDAGESSTEYRLPPQTAFEEEMRADSTTLYNHQASRHGERTIAYFSHMLPGGSIETIPPELLTKKTGIQRWHPDRLSRAVVTAFEDFVHYRVNRIPNSSGSGKIANFSRSV